MNKQQVISSHHIECLPAVVGKAPKILILGTIPGDKSLKLRKYYQDRSSLFWEMIENVFNGGNALSDYHSQISCLFRNHIALWDIIKSCDRKGSSDRNIRNPNYNEIEDFLCKHPTIRLIILNGKNAVDRYINLNIPTPILIAPYTSNRNGKKKVFEIWKKLFLSTLMTF